MKKTDIILNEILNVPVDTNFLKIIDRHFPRAPQHYKESSKQEKIDLFKEMRREIRNVIVNALRDSTLVSNSNIEEFLDENLFPRFRFDYDSDEVKIIMDFNLQSFSSDPKTYFCEKIALELYEFLLENGLGGFKNCKRCRGSFIPVRSDQRFCTNRCKQIAYKQRKK